MMMLENGSAYHKSSKIALHSMSLDYLPTMLIKRFSGGRKSAQTAELVGGGSI